VSDTDQTRKLTNAEVTELCRAAQAELSPIPGLIRVIWGEKRKGGKPTGVIGLCVYVEKKLDASSLDPAHVIPSQFRGVATDVDEPGDAKRTHCDDMGHYDPLIGGITITSEKTSADGGYGAGTLGFFATIDGVAPPENVALVSNHHVLFANGGGLQEKIYQQPKVEVASGLAIDWTTKYLAGTLTQAGLDGSYDFTYPGEAQAPYFIDCAAAKLDYCISSWCHTKCGVSMRNEINGLALPSGNGLVDVARVEAANVGSSYVVYKVGARTSRTVGYVSRVDPGMLHGERNVIEITAVSMSPSCDPPLRFCDEGDSGSALVDAQGKLIGLVFALERTNPLISYACQIHPCLARLGVTPITNAHPAPSAATASLEAARVDLPDQVEQLRARLRSSARGRRILELAEAHRREIMQLIDHDRRVTVAWHRSQGPAYFNRAARSARNPEFAVPKVIEGVTRAEVVRTMAKVLAERGSEALRQMVAANVAEALALANGPDRLHQLAEELTSHESA
jgi:hypothetical protein